MRVEPTPTALDIDAMLDRLSNWGRWGKQDERGALNLITPQRRVEAARLVREGRAVSLSRDAIKTSEDDSPPFEHAMVETGWNNQLSSSDIYSVRYHGFTVTHLDALCHVFHCGRMYNGYSQREVTERGAEKLAVARVKDGLFTRAILMDIPRLFGVRYLNGTTRILPADLDRWERSASVQVVPGDALVLRTGRWSRRAELGPWPIMQNSAGLHYSCMPWIRERDVSVLVSDLASDVMPSGVGGRTAGPSDCDCGAGRAYHRQLRSRSAGRGSRQARALGLSADRRSPGGGRWNRFADQPGRDFLTFRLRYSCDRYRFTINSSCIVCARTPVAGGGLMDRRSRWWC